MCRNMADNKVLNFENENTKQKFYRNQNNVVRNETSSTGTAATKMYKKINP